MIRKNIDRLSICLLFLILVTSGCVSASSSPSDTVDSFLSEQVGSSPDFESIYGYYSSDVQAEEDFDSWYERVQPMAQGERQDGGIEYEITEVRSEAIDEDTAEVNFTYRIYAMGQVMDTRTETLELVKQDNWKIDEMYVIYQSVNR